MSRAVYTYTDLARLRESRNFWELAKYPHITVSADLRKCLNGRPEVDRVRGLAAGIGSFRATEFSSLARAADGDWNTDPCKFRQMTFLFAFLREKLMAAGDDRKQRNWLIGCMRNQASLLSSILLLEQAGLRAEDLQPDGDRNLELLAGAWRYLEKEDPAIGAFRARMKSLAFREAWKPIFKKVFNLHSLDGVDTLVFHGFYYITPHQEQIMRLLEQAGFRLVYLIPYDERYPFVHEIWDETYAAERGYDAKADWHMERSFEGEPYGEVFEGRKARPLNRLTLKEYASMMEFVNDVRHIREQGFTLYSADYRTANQVLKDYFPESYGDRKLLSYPIGQFISTLNRMWDEELQTIAVSEEQLIECFSSGWLAVDGVSGRQYLQDLIYVLPFFHGCHTLDEWGKRMELLEEIEESAVRPFETERSADGAVARWQEAIGNPLKNFSVFAVAPERLDVILKLIRQIFEMAGELFGQNEPRHVQDYIRTLDQTLKKHAVSQELYAEERELIRDIFEKLGADNGFDALCRPADTAAALELYLSGHYEEGEVQTSKIGLVRPLYLVDAACVKSRGKVHLCLCDVESLPGGNKDYIWPLSRKKMEEIFARIGNPLLQNLMQIMESTALCNRYFTYCALRNREVTLSFVSARGEKLLAPSPYIRLLQEATGTTITPSARDAITYSRVSAVPLRPGRIKDYDKGKMPEDTVREARMDYALCPMKYLLSYVLEKYPVYQSDFQMQYALNALISAISHLMEEQGMKVDEAYEAVMALFPWMRRAQKRQVYDYISHDLDGHDLDYGNRTECGGRYYTDERLKLHYPNQDVRTEVNTRYGRLNTPDGRKGLDLYEAPERQDACSFCPHVAYCRNARYVGDQESYYD
ncbi:MAG: hypothetical protein LIO86_00210 [Lachnospiraceae bacterium]|nr:hypothetical protein [Lachnospiraceae bacterium]